MVPPREFHKGRGRFWGEQRLGRGQGRGATRRDRRGPGSQPKPRGWAHWGEKPSGALTAVLVNLLLAALSGASNARVQL
jgi:hypothetical protein